MNIRPPDELKKPHLRMRITALIVRHARLPEVSPELSRYLILSVLLFTAAAMAQGKGTTNPIPHFDSTSVWHPPADFRKVFDSTCDTLRGDAFQACFLKTMRGMGASEEAVRFAELTDTTGYVRKFVKSGLVDIAYVCYPFRANENYGVILVNGRPGMIDVDDFQYVDLTPLKRNTMYLHIVNDFPDAAVWPGDRYLFDQPILQPIPGGGQRFIVKYILQNGCHACRHLAVVEFGFDFDRNGIFKGTRLLRVTSLLR